MLDSSLHSQQVNQVAGRIQHTTKVIRDTAQTKACSTIRITQLTSPRDLCTKQRLVTPSTKEMMTDKCLPPSTQPKRANRVKDTNQTPHQELRLMTKVGGRSPLMRGSKTLRKWKQSLRFRAGLSF